MFRMYMWFSFQGTFKRHTFLFFFAKLINGRRGGCQTPQSSCSHTSVTVHCPSGLREQRPGAEPEGPPRGGTLAGCLSLSAICPGLLRPASSSSPSSSLSLLPDAHSYDCSASSPSTSSTSGWLMESWERESSRVEGEEGRGLGRWRPSSVTGRAGGRDAKIPKDDD